MLDSTFRIYFSRFSLVLFNLLTLGCGFNLDVDTPVFKIGPPDSYFGYAVAGHFLRNKDFPRMLIGAPRGDTGQPGTVRTGAVYSCPINMFPQSVSSTRNPDEWCEKIQVEYAADDLSQFDEPPGSAYFNAKRDQLLGSVISSAGTANGSVLVCAPNAIFDDHAYMDGKCYLLHNDLSQSKVIRTCQTWPKQKRHNDWGSCQEGFSAAMRQDFDLLVTGLPGAKRWVGGANVQEIEHFNYQRFTTKAKGPSAVEDVLPAHSYLGFSVGIGMFGFGHEEKGVQGNFTVVAGGPRFNETGAVFFLPFSKSRSVSDLDELLLLTDHYKLIGDGDFASSFGYSLAVADIDHDGFDDLIVGSPHYFEPSTSTPNGGAVYIYFSMGKKQLLASNEAVFQKPFKLLGPKGSQFGTAVAGVDLNNDKMIDIVVGAPFDQKGGAIYIYSGAKFTDFDVKPSQIIYAKDLRYNPVGESLSTFGWSLFGGADLDNSKYADLLVGAFNSSAVILMRAKPVINFIATINEDKMEPIDKDRQNCRLQNAKACFKVETILSVKETEGIDYRLNFICRLEVLPHERSGNVRAFFENGKPKKDWSCRVRGLNPLIEEQELFILESNRDWLNPINMKFSIHLEDRRPPIPQEGGSIISLNDYPVINKKGSEKKFQVEFDNKCGLDRKCQSKLDLQCRFNGLEKDANGVYVKDVGVDENIDLTFSISNYNGERAYETILYVEYDNNLVELPQYIQGSVNLGKREKGVDEYIIDNPLIEDGTASFTLRFSLIRGQSGLKTGDKPLRILAFVNTTSDDLNIHSNNCSMDVRVVTRAELDLKGYSTPEHRQLLYGGKVVGESAMEFFGDIGDEVQHIYELKNEGPWSVSNVSIIVDFPVEVNSTYPHGKWALYITDAPTVRVANPGSTDLIVSKECDIELHLRNDYINPLKLKDEIVADNKKSSAGRVRRRKRNHGHDKRSGTMKYSRPAVPGRIGRELRIKPIEMDGGDKKVTIDCLGDPANRTAKCVRIKCQVFNLAKHGNATVTIISRLWNSTFVEDYRDVNKIEIISRARVDKEKAILENDDANNFAFAITEAYPDLPAIPEKSQIPIWYIILAVIGGIFVLLCIIIILWKCGFFVRRRHADQPLYKAEYKHNDEFDT